MKRTFFALIAAASLVGFAAAAGAASLTIVADAATYNVGDTITLTITGDSDGEIAPASTQDLIRVIVAHDLALVSANGRTGAGTGGATGNGVFSQFGGGAQALVGGLEGDCAWVLGRDDQCLVFDQALQISGAAETGIPVVGTFTYMATAAGVANFVFQDEVGLDLIFFSLGNTTDAGTAPAGISVTIVPEPTTAALLGLGLFGLALAGRRR